MPLTEYQKKYIIEQSGYSPDDYDVDESSKMIVPRIKESPTISTTPVNPVTDTPQVISSDTPLQTFGKSFGEAAPTAVGAGLGTAGGIAAASWLLGPEIGLPTTLIAALLGGFGGGAIAKGIQESVEPEEWSVNVAESAAQNPKAALAGQLSTIPLSGFKMSPKVLATGAGAIPKLATGMARTPEEILALKNIGIGTSMGAVTPVATSLVETGELPAGKDILMNALIGSLFNEPNMIGRRLGFQPTFGGPKQLPNAEELMFGDPIRQPIDVQAEVTPTGLTPDEISATGGLPRGSREEIRSGSLKTVAERSDAMAKFKRDVQPTEEEIARFEGEGGIQQRIVSREPTREMPDATGREIVKVGRHLPAKRPDEQGNIQLQTQSQVVGKTEFSKQINDALTEKEIPTEPTRQWTDLFKRFGILKRNAEVMEDGSIVNTLTGQPIAGQATTFPDALKKAVVKLNPEKMGIDTAPHELGHVFFHQLRNSKNPVDRKFIEKFDKLISESPEYQKLATELGWTPEEFIVTEQGLEFLRRNLNLSGESGLKTWWKDFSGHVKNMVGKDMSNAEMRRLLQYRFQYDAPFHEYHKTGIKVSDAFGRTSRQDESETTKMNSLEQDIADYRRLDDIRNKQIADGTAFTANQENFTPEFKKLWQDIENIKNKHGGMPPRKAIEMPESTTSLQESSEITPASHVSVKDTITKALTAAEADMLTVDAGEELATTLSAKVDWSSMPEVKKMLDAKEFDYLDPAHWNQVAKVYDNYLKQPSEDIAPPKETITTPKTPVEKPVLKVEKPAKVAEKSAVAESGTGMKKDAVIDYMQNRFNTLMAERDAALRKGDKATVKAKMDEINNLLKIASTKMQDTPEIRKSKEKSMGEALTDLVIGPKKNIKEYQRLMALQDKAMRIAEFHDSQKSIHNPAIQEILSEQPSNIKEFEDKMNRIIAVGESGSSSNQDIPEIKKQPSEGRTPYPFKLKELERGEKALLKTDEEAFDSITDINTQIPEGIKEVRQAQELNSLYDPDQNILNQNESAVKKERHSFAPFLTSRFDKIAEKIPGKTSNYVVPKLHAFSKEVDILTGRLGNRLIAATRDYTPEQIQRVYRHLYQMDDTGSSVINLTGRERKLADNITSQLQDTRKLQNELGLKVKEGQTYRAGGIKPEGYMFNVLDPQVAYIWSRQPNSAEAKRFDKLYIDHLVKHGEDAKTAREILFEYKNALGNNVTSNTEFNALRKAEGKGLPWELIDKNFNNASLRYGKRAARDLAYFKWIQNDPKMLKALNLRDQFGKLPSADTAPEIESIATVPETKEALRSVFGIDTPRNPTAMAFARAAANTVMGVGTAARNIVNMPSFISNYIQLKQLPKLAQAISHMNESRVRAFENNAVRADFEDFDAAGYYLGNPNPVIRALDKYSSFMRKYQGRNLSDKFEGEYYYSLGELLATDNIARAKLGDKDAKEFVKKFSSTVEGDVLKRKVTQDDISRMAKSFVDNTRGTYSEQGLPSFAIEGELAPFFSLNRFAIEKSNTIWKDVIEPARKGNFAPLLKYTLASFGVALSIEKLNEILSNKRGPEPTINEVLASGDKGDLVAKAISLAQLSSFAGYVSDGAQLVSNMARGKGLKYSNPVSFPLYTLVTDTIAGNISDAYGAIQDGEDPFEVMGKFVTSLSTQAVQSARYLDANFLHPEEAERKEKFRDYNIWQELTDRKDEEPVTGRANEMKGIASKRFKRTGDLNEAAVMVPELINKAIENSKDSRGNVDYVKLKKEFGKLKLNSYQIMPALETDPKAFVEYYEYLRSTQGEKEANERMTDFLQQREVNKVKNQMVPSL